MKHWCTSLAIVAAGILTAAGAEAATLTVGPGGAHRTISEAVTAARDGDTIQVHAGVYYEQVVLDKRLTLEGLGKPRLVGGDRGSVLVVTADGCVVKGLLIEHSGSDLQREDSGVLLKSNDNIIEGNELRDVLYGIYLLHSARNTIRQNVIRGRTQLELGERGAALHLWNSPDNTIEDNAISDARDGLYIQSSPGNVIRRNRVYGLRYGVHYMTSDDNTFEDNTFARNVAGAAIMYSRRIQFRRNAFIHNRGFSSFGILFQDCDDCLAEGNFIIDNTTGIFMEALRKSTFRNNVIAENDIAIEMFSSASENVFQGNNFVENTSPLRLVGRSSTTRWSLNGRGNYWGDYGGYDLDGDGIGDVPHKVQNVFEYMEGNHPRLRIYLDSPAAQALATAERTFPVIEGSREMDPAPLMKPTEMRSQADDAAAKPATQASLAALSMMLLTAAGAVMWKGRRRRQTR